MASRPAETGAGVAGSFAFLILYGLGVEDPGVLYATTVVVGFVPAAITWAVTKWRGKAE